MGHGSTSIPTYRYGLLFFPEIGDFGKRITYLKVDIEGAEISCIKQWLKSGVLQFVDQLGKCAVLPRLCTSIGGWMATT